MENAETRELPARVAQLIADLRAIDASDAIAATAELWRLMCPAIYEVWRGAITLDEDAAISRERNRACDRINARLQKLEQSVGGRPDPVN